MRYVWLILFLLALAAPFAVRRAVVPALAGASAATDIEKLVVVTPHNQDIRDEFARAFDAWHRRRYGSGVALDYRVPGGSNDVLRLLETTYRAYRRPDGKPGKDVRADLDVVWGGGDYLFDVELRPLGILQPIDLSGKLASDFRAAFPAPTLAGVKLYDPMTGPDGAPTPRWIGVCLSSFGICYNPDLYRSLGMEEPSADHGWHDLTDPRLAGLIALADPAHSGSSAVAFEMVIQHDMAAAEQAFFLANPHLQSLSKKERATNPRYNAALAAGWKHGMSELLKIAANARYFTDSSTIVPMDVSRGEAAAGMAIDFYARVTQESAGAGRIRFVAPTGATAITPDPVAILYGVKGRKLELARRFVAYLLSAQGQRLWILRAGVPGGPIDRSLRRPPIRRDLYADRSGWADDIDPFESSRGFNQRGEWMSLFGDTRPIWVAAWIDSRDALQEAYSAILRVPNANRRAALIDELASLPIEMSDVQAIQARRKQIEQSHGELDEWRAIQQIRWARTFSEHYQRVRRNAESELARR